MSRLAAISAEGAIAVGAGARLIDGHPRSRSRSHDPGRLVPERRLGGLALGGGIGFASRKLGTTSDNVVGVRIVTAFGAVVDCDRGHHEDLYASKEHLERPAGGQASVRPGQRLRFRQSIRPR